MAGKNIGAWFVPGEYPLKDGIKDSTYVSDDGAPTIYWDADDTVGIGVEFETLSRVQDSLTGAIYVCQDNTAGAAIWNLITQERV